MQKQNCWEFKKCGREKPNEHGICPAAIETSADGMNKGINGGRICWAVAGTFCDGEIQGTYAQKFLTCTTCDFRIKVKDEEGYKFKYIYFKNGCSPMGILTLRNT